MLKKEREFLSGLMAISMKESLQTTILTDSVFSHTRVAEFIKETGEMESDAEEENSYFRVETSIQENS